MDQDRITRELIAAGVLFHQRGWVPGTGGNFSARLAPERILITASGCHKGELGEHDFLVADLDGRPLNSERKASYETLLHCQLYRHAATGSVLHTHSVANTVLSRRLRQVRLEGYELLKILPGVSTHDASVEIPVFDNDQDIARLSRAVEDHLHKHPLTPAYLLRGHGLYTWGANVAQARHRVEALEFMFECELHSLK